MPTRQPFAVGEWYHCYNRGLEKHTVYRDKRDYERFMLGLFLANSDRAVHISNLKSPNLHDVLGNMNNARGAALVEVGVYSLMPNHFHLLLREVTDNGIARFMQKLCTGYTMYFNTRRERTGALFGGTFKSKHVADDRYLKQLVPYIHLNSAELFDPSWKIGQGNVRTIQRSVSAYPYSSLPDFLGTVRPERNIIGDTLFVLYERMPTISDMVRIAHEYYAEQYQG